VNMSKAMRMRMNTRMMRQGLLAPRRGEEGIALVTTLVLLFIMTVLGVGAVATTALENRIAGFQRTGEQANSAAEACVGTSMNIIKQTIAAANVVPPAFYATANDPVPSLAAPTLGSEISSATPNDPDTTSGIGAAGPDYSQQINGYNVVGDIDHLYKNLMAGSQDMFAYVYRIDCRATLPAPAVGSESHVVAIYACSMVLGSGSCKTL
jgi:Tfp pilus assembly protein PilX